MQERSELEKFLASTSAEGQVDSQGVFTLGREEALRKIAEHQLPFAGAWGIKIIQSIVAGQRVGPISVDLTATEARFRFTGAGFTLDEFSAAFYTPEPSPNRALRHLLFGLWAVALKERWGFQIALADQTETLIWDGARLNRVESSLARDHTCISVAHQQQKAARSWVVGAALSANRNAELLLALDRNCYTCPLPLTVDGRRIDSLQRAAFQGWEKYRYPIAIDVAQAPLPELRLPPGTFEGVTRDLAGSSLLDDGGGWRMFAEKRLKNLTARQSAPLAFILCVSLKLVGSGKEKSLEAGEGPSTAYWVLDGALVGKERLGPAASHCSVGCFLSAEGLRTDLSTIRLVESPERGQRLGRARKAIATALKSMDTSTFDDMVKRGQLFHNLFGGTVMVVGLTALWQSFFAGAVFLALGGWLVAGGGKRESGRVQSARISIRDLIIELRS